MIRRLIQATSATALLAASSLPLAAMGVKPEASAATSTKPAIVNVFPYEGAYHCGGGCAPDGEGSSNSLMRASDGNFYGATVSGGASTFGVYGVLFRVTPDGIYTDIHDFGFSPDGATVVTSLMQAADGNLYGVTDAGGDHYNGTIFQYNLATGAFTTLYSFANGGDSYSQLIDDGNGHLYGTTSYDGVNSLGNIFSWNYKTGTYTDIYDFTNGVDGQRPWAGIVIASDGRIYGTSRFGGPTDHTGSGLGDGVAWSINTDGTRFKAIHNFGSSATDGYSPVQGFVEAADGTLFSTTLNGGNDCSAINFANGCGTLYKITPNANQPTYTQVYAFSQTAGQGVGPQHSAPTLGGDGKIYVLAQVGGPADGGQLMAFTTAGAYTDVHDFGVLTASDTSGLPAAAVLEDQSGNLWGGTSSGSTNQNGEIFKIEAGIAPGMTLTASTIDPDVDQAVQLTWNVTNAFSTSAKLCFASSSDGSFTGLKAISGTAKVMPTKPGTMTYSLTCGGSQTAIATVDVAPVIVTATTITSVPSTLTYGQTGTVVALVAVPSGTVSGTAQLVSGSKVLGTGSVVNGKAEITLATYKMMSGSYSVQVKYEGNHTYAASASGTTTIVIAKITPTVKLAVSPTTIVDGVPATATVSVSNGVGTPGDNVVFRVAGKTIASVPLVSGSASVSIDTSLYTAGTYAVTAAYGGDGNDTSASTTQTITIAKDSTTTTLAAASSVVSGKALVATITVNKPNLPGVATGTVQLLRDGKVIATGTLSNGSAVISSSTTGLSAGTYSLSAVYLGDTRSAASSSASKSLTVTTK